jgi:Ca-activated chloride channel family protein
MAIIELARPELLLLAPFFLALTLMSYYFAQKLKRSLEVFHYPPTRRLMKLVVKKGVRRHSWRGINLALKIIVVMLITFGLSNPFFLAFSETTQVIDVPVVEEKDLVGGLILAVDVSASMGISDVAPKRLDAAKEVLTEFVRNASDKVRFGVVAFDSDVRDSAALTDDKAIVVSTLAEQTVAPALPCLEESTDIGLGLNTALDLLTPYAGSNKTYAVVLVSDGLSNYGHPDPITSVVLAAGRAIEMEIPIYSLHLARMGQDSNPELMKIIADETGGEFMDSTSLEELESVLNIVGKYHAPTNPWTAKVEAKTTVPSRTELTPLLMLVAMGVILVLWAGNYRHYKTSF